MINSLGHGVIYCRVSSKEQAEGTSLESQEVACRDFARAKSIKILKVFVERGESAKFADRTQLLQLIDFCRRNKSKVQALIVWKVDRFARNVADHFNVKATLMKYGVRIMSVTEPIDTNPEGKLMETILAGFAQFDNDIRAMRCTQGMRQRLQDGIYPFKPPLGYKSSTENGENKRRPDEPDQPLFGLLQKAWKEFATGAYTKAEVRRLMSSWGVVTRNGTAIPPQSVDSLFSNPYYAGILVDPWSGEEYQGKHVAMVTRQEFAQVQQTIGKRRRSVPHQKERPEFPLRGFVRCDDCRRPLTGSLSRSRSRRYAYYHCYSKRCGAYGRSWPADTIHREFLGFLDTVAPNADLIPKVEALVRQVAEQHWSQHRSRKVRLDSRLKDVNRQIGELLRLKTQGLITDQEFIEQKAALSEQRMALESRTLDNHLDPDKASKDLREVMRPLSNLRATWTSLVGPSRGRFQQLVLPVGFAKGKVGTAELGLLFTVFEASKGGSSHGVDLAVGSWNRLWQEIQGFLRIFEKAGWAKKA